jgi:hypothetical protein
MKIILALFLSCLVASILSQDCVETNSAFFLTVNSVSSWYVTASYDQNTGIHSLSLNGRKSYSPATNCLDGSSASTDNAGDVAITVTANSNQVQFVHKMTLDDIKNKYKCKYTPSANSMQDLYTCSFQMSIFRKGTTKAATIVGFSYVYKVYVNVKLAVIIPFGVTAKFFDLSAKAAEMTLKADNELWLCSNNAYNAKHSTSPNYSYKYNDQLYIKLFLTDRAMASAYYLRLNQVSYMCDTSVNKFPYTTKNEQKGVLTFEGPAINVGFCAISITAELKTSRVRSRNLAGKRILQTSDDADGSQLNKDSDKFTVSGGVSLQIAFGFLAIFAFLLILL